MRKLHLILFALALALPALGAASGEGTVVLVDVGNIVSGNVANRRVTLTLTWPNPRSFGNLLVAVDPVAQRTDANGVAGFTNVQYGDYRIDIAGAPGTIFAIQVPDTNNVVFHAAALLDPGSTNAPNPINDFYTKAQVDALLASSTPGGGNFVVSSNGAATNMNAWNTFGFRASAAGPAVQWRGFWTDTHWFLTNVDSYTVYDFNSSGYLTAPGGFAGDGARLSGTQTNVLAGSVIGDLQFATNFPYQSIVSIATNCSSNSIYIRNLTTTSNGNASVAYLNQTWYPVNNHDYTNANNSAHIYYTETDPDLSGAYVFVTATNEPIFSTPGQFLGVFGQFGDPCTEHALTDIDFNSIPDSFFLGTNYASSAAPLVVSNVLNAVSNRLFTNILGLAVLRTNYWLDLKRDFGAVGNGVVDDSTALQNAVNALGASRSCLYIPEGNYRIERTNIILPPLASGTYGPTIIKGAGAMSILHFYAQAITPSLTNTEGLVLRSNAYNVVIQDLTFAGPVVSGLGYTADNIGTAIRVYNGGTAAGGSPGVSCHGLKIVNCVFNGFGRAIVMTNTWETTIRDCYMQNIVKSMVEQSGCHNTRYENCLMQPYFDNGPTQVTENGIWMQRDDGNGAGDDATFYNMAMSGFTNCFRNDGDVSMLVLGGHFEINGTLLLMTNASAWPVRFINCSVWDTLGSDNPAGNATTHFATFTVCPETLAMLTIDGLFRSDGESNPRVTFNIPADPNGVGYRPPLILGHSGSVAEENVGLKLAWLGVRTNRVYSIPSRGPNRKQDALIVFSNSPPNWPPYPIPYGSTNTAALVNSNGILFELRSTSGTNWTDTNLVYNASVGGGSTPGTITNGNLFAVDLGNFNWKFGQHIYLTNRGAFIAITNQGGTGDGFLTGPTDGNGLDVSGYISSIIQHFFKANTAAVMVSNNVPFRVDGTAGNGNTSISNGVIFTTDGVNTPHLIGYLDSRTNGWPTNSTFVLGVTNQLSIVSANAAGGITGLSSIGNVNDTRWGELVLQMTGDVTFTNPASFNASDGVTSRTFTSGTFAKIRVDWQQGVSTNMTITRYGPQGVNAVTFGSPLFAPQVSFSTNLTGAPDFALGYSMTNVGANFTLGAPLNQHSGKARVETAVWLVKTNGTGSSPWTMTSPSGVVSTGTLFVTNVTVVTAWVYGNVITNYHYTPIN